MVFTFFKNLEHVIKESIIKSTLSYCSSYESARRHLGLILINGLNL